MNCRRNCGKRMFVFVQKEKFRTSNQVPSVNYTTLISSPTPLKQFSVRKFNFQPSMELFFSETSIICQLRDLMLSLEGWNVELGDKAWLKVENIHGSRLLFTKLMIWIMQTLLKQFTNYHQSISSKYFGSKKWLGAENDNDPIVGLEIIIIQYSLLARGRGRGWDQWLYTYYLLALLLIRIFIFPLQNIIPESHACC